MLSEPLTRLLQVLRERESQLGHDNIAWAFQSAPARRDIEQWVVRYLSPHTLLSLEEYSFEQTRTAAGSRRISSSRPLRDAEFESAVKSLEKGRTELEQQCRTLEAQKQALQRIQAKGVSCTDRSIISIERLNKILRRRAQQTLHVEQSANDLREKLASSLKQAETAAGTITLNAQRILEKDDNLLDGLEKHLPRLAVDNGDGALEEADQLCSALATYTSADIHARIDFAYDSNIVNEKSQVNDGHSTMNVNGSQQQRRALRAELDELCHEIDGLSTMAVDSQYRQPILTAARAARDSAALEKLAWSEFLDSMLQYLTSRTEIADEYFQNLSAYTHTLKAASLALDEVLTASTESTRAVAGSAPSPRKPSQNRLKPLRLVQANLSEMQDPSLQALRHFDVHVNGIDDPSKLAQDLSMATDREMQNLSALAQSSDGNTTRILSQSTARIDADLDALLGAVYTHSNYGSVRLESCHVRDSIASLEARTDQISDEMRNLDINEITRAVKLGQQALLRRLAQAETFGDQ